VLVKQLAADEAIAAADTLLPDRSESAGRGIQRPRHQQHLKFVAPGLGWR
jgi:hypothetical protein